jgi:hypothetical protein
MFGLQELALYVKRLARWWGDLVGMLNCHFGRSGPIFWERQNRWLCDDVLVLVPCLVPCTLGNSVVAKVKKKFGACGV